MPNRKNRNKKTRKPPTTSCGTVTRKVHDVAKKIEEKGGYPSIARVSREVHMSAERIAKALRKVYGETVDKKMSHPKRNGPERRKLDLGFFVCLVCRFGEDFLDGKTPHVVLKDKMKFLLLIISELPGHERLKLKLLGYKVGKEES